LMKTPRERGFLFLSSSTWREAAIQAPCQRKYNRAAMPTDIVLITTARALIEVAGLMLIARGGMWLIGPRAREHNFFYWVLTAGTLPFIRLARRVCPRTVSDTYVPVVAFVLLVILWIAAGVAKEWLCSVRSAQCV
jgi:hypothetical protein